jgi:hypothetical protein
MEKTSMAAPWGLLPVGSTAATTVVEEDVDGSMWPHLGVPIPSVV